MVKPVLTTFSQTEIEDIMQYERYLPSAFDDSLNMLQKINKLIKQLQTIGAISNDVVAKWNEVNEWLLNEGLEEAVNAEFDNRVTDGTFESLINTTVLADILAQLASKADNTNVRQSTATLKIALSELGADVTAALTGGAVASVAKNGVSNEHLQTASLTPFKTSFLQQKSKSVLDPRTIKIGGFYSPSNGNWSTNASYKASDAIPVLAGEYYKGNHISIAVYDDAMTILTVASPVNGVHLMPANAKFARFNFDATNAYPAVAKVTGNSASIPSPYYEDYKYGDDYLLMSKKNVSPDFEISERHASFFNKIRTANYFDKDKTIKGRYDLTGVYGNQVGTISSDLIPCADGERWTCSTSGHVSFFSSTGNFLSGLNPTNYFNVPVGQGIAFFRKAVLTGNENSEMIVKGETLPENYVGYYAFELNYQRPENPYAEYSKLNGLKWGVMGDSLTDSEWGDIEKYHSFIGKRYSMQITSYGIGGTRIQRDPARTDSMIERYSSMRNDLDIVTVLGSYNDMTSGLPIGVMSDRVDTTFYGAMHLLCEGLLDKYRGKAIGFIIPPYTASPSRPRATHDQYSAIIREVCQYHSIPYLDLLWGGNLNPNIASHFSNFFFDVTHPNSLGQEMMAKRIAPFLESLVY